MKYSINKNLINKPDKPTVEKYNKYFVDCETNVAGLASWVGQGYAFAIATYGGENRNKENVKEVQVLALDFDNEKGDYFSLEEAINHPYIKDKACLVYTSPSHTDEKHKFRIVFRLERPISVALTEYTLQERMLSAFPQADTACKTAQFFFFGSDKAQIPLLSEQNVITNEEIDQLEKDHAEYAAKVKEEKEAREHTQSDIPANLDRDEEMAYRALQHIPQRVPGTGTYDCCKDVFIAIIRHFGKEKGLEIIKWWSPELDEKGSGWDDLNKKADGVLARDVDSPLGFGTVIQIASENGFKVKQVSRELYKKYNPYWNYKLPEQVAKIPALSISQFMSIASEHGFKWENEGIIDRWDKNKGFIPSDKFTQDYCWGWFGRNSVDFDIVENTTKAKSKIKEGKLAIAVSSLPFWVPAKQAKPGVIKLEKELVQLFGKEGNRKVNIELSDYADKEDELAKELISALPLHNWNSTLSCDGIETDLNDLAKKEAFNEVLAELEQRNKITPTRDEIKQQYLENLTFHPNTKLIGIKSAKGTGKSSWYQKLVQQIKAEGRRVLLLVHREKLGQELANKARLPYLREILDLGNNYGLCLCGDSLHPKSAVGRQLEELLKDPNLVIILDEAEQSLRHLIFSSTSVAKHRPDVFATFRRALQSAFNPEGQGKVIACDADLTDRSLNFLKQFAGVPHASTEVVVNTYKKSERECRVYTDKEIWLTDLREALQQCVEDKGKGFKQRSIHIVLQAVDTKSPLSARSIEELINKEFRSLVTLRADSKSAKDPNHPVSLALMGDFNGVLEHGFKDFKLYNKAGNKFIDDMHPDEQKLIQSQQMQEEIAKRIEALADYFEDQVDVLISTQTLGTGISLDSPIFKEVFANFAGVGAADDGMQSIERVRDTENYKVRRSILIAEKAYASDKRITSTNPNKVLSEVTASIASSLTLSYPEKKNDFVDERENFEEFEFVVVHNPLLLYAQKLALQNFEIKHYRELLIHRLREEGFELQFINTEKDTSIKQKLKEIAKYNHTKELEEITEAEDITKQTYEKQSTKPELTKQESHANTKYVVKKRWGIESPNTSHIEAYQKGLDKKEMRNFLVMEGDACKAKDKAFIDSQLKPNSEPFVFDLHKKLVSGGIALLQKSELGLIEWIKEINQNRDITNELLENKRKAKKNKEDKFDEKKKAEQELEYLEGELEEENELGKDCDQDKRKETQQKIAEKLEEISKLEAEYDQEFKIWKDSIKHLASSGFTSSSKTIQTLARKALKYKAQFKKHFGIKLRSSLENAAEIAGQILRLVGIELTLVQRGKDKNGNAQRHYLPVHETRDIFDLKAITEVFDYWRRPSNPDQTSDTETINSEFPTHKAA